MMKRRRGRRKRRKRKMRMGPRNHLVRLYVWHLHHFLGEVI
jgi:hypothetical protein